MIITSRLCLADVFVGFVGLVSVAEVRARHGKLQAELKRATALATRVGCSGTRRAAELTAHVPELRSSRCLFLGVQKSTGRPSMMNSGLRWRM